MKKLLWLLLLLLLMTGAVYLLIPNRMVWKESEAVAVSAKAFNRLFSDESTWPRWWPGKSSKNDSNKTDLQFNGNTYRISIKRFSSFVIEVETKHGTIPSELLFIPVNDDSVNLAWSAGGATSYNPVARVQRSLALHGLQKDMATILQRIKAFYSEANNFYSVKIKADFVVDSTLIQTRQITTGYPSTQTIYALIDKLQAFAKTKGARQTGLPMLNIYTQDSTTYRVQVALPVDKKLQDEGDVVYKWMLGGGNILVTEIRGGPATINKAFDEMEKYVQDNRRVAPAIPFQSLVTDRRAEPDTSKWVTKLYWPVM